MQVGCRVRLVVIRMQNGCFEFLSLGYGTHFELGA